MGGRHVGGPSCGEYSPRKKKSGKLNKNQHFLKLNLKIICNSTGNNPFGQTCRDHAASDYLRLNPLVLAGFPWGDHAGERSGLPG